VQLGLPQSHIQLKSEVFWFVLLHVISWIVLVFLDKRNFAQKVGRNVEFGFADVRRWLCPAGRVTLNMGSAPGPAFGSASIRAKPAPAAQPRIIQHLLRRGKATASHRTAKP